MDYRQFERLVLLLGGSIILASALATMSDAFTPQDLVAQFFLFGVLAAAIHRGRRMGFVAAAAASLVYITVFVSQAAAGTSMSRESLIIVLSRVLAFGLVGIIAGEASGRIKYSLAALGGQGGVDRESGVYNQEYGARVLDAARGRLERYEEPYSVLTVYLADGLWADLSPKRRRQFIRSAASHLRSDVRLVDEVARFEDGGFLVVLPRTAKPGGQVAAQRVAAGLRGMLGATERAVRVTCYGGEEDAGWIDTALRLMRTGQSSDAYSSEESRTLKPASLNTPVAASSSTFKTSTAASPEVPTKQ